MNCSDKSYLKMRVDMTELVPSRKRAGKILQEWRVRMSIITITTQRCQTVFQDYVF